MTVNIELNSCVAPGFRFQWALLQGVCQKEQSVPQIGCSIEKAIEVYGFLVDEP